MAARLRYYSPAPMTTIALDWFLVECDGEVCPILGTALMAGDAQETGFLAGEMQDKGLFVSSHRNWSLSVRGKQVTAVPLDAQRCVFQLMDTLIV
ncbi:uncharacterized protein PgNI_01027 [Pyricularia grisea]|uniref:Uncharacterized protein n=1 Tax=Pyricularia grisea TaxID=148305 RepID=A0A6P8BH61_PYRGI|nr:uncharacterized protein PgNI_01027 [Pyricularia grisea]TLD16045.1 hypothetical protein PgNI_01027 [Pyricularia grisea]